MEKKDSFFDDLPVVAVYTRAEALEDGVLVDITDLAKEAGFSVPVAVTSGIFAMLGEDIPGQDFEGRTWDLLTIFKLNAKNSKSDVVKFAPLFVREYGKKPAPVQMWSKIGPGDQGEAVITIMLEGED